MIPIKKFLLTAVLLFTLSASQAQYILHEKGYGLAGIYNLPIGEIGFQGHMNYHLNDMWIISPQVEFFPGFSQVQELNAGAMVRYIINPLNDIGFYPTAGYHFNWWMNYANSPSTTAKQFNSYPDIGAGVQTNYKCIRYFAEYRVNLKWMESSVRAGITWYPFACGDDVSCPTYALPKH